MYIVIHISKENFSSTISWVSCIHFNILIYLMVDSRVKKSCHGQQTISARSAYLLNVGPNICNNITLIILLFDLLSVLSPVRVCYQLVRCKLVISGRAPDRQSPLLFLTLYNLLFLCCMRAAANFVKSNCDMRSLSATFGGLSGI